MHACHMFKKLNLNLTIKRSFAAAGNKVSVNRFEMTMGDEKSHRIVHFSDPSTGLFILLLHGCKLNAAEETYLVASYFEITVIRD